MSRRVERSFEGHVVVVHTFTGPSLQGVLVSAGRDAWLLGGVTHLDDDVTLSGQVSVPRANGYLQLPKRGI